MSTNIQIDCHVCGRSDFKDYGEFAKHIIDNKKTHRKSLKWASAYALKVNILNRKKDMPAQRVPLTEDEKQNKRDSKQELSGVTKTVSTSCPVCKCMSRQSLPVEYVNEPSAWRKNGVLVVSCDDCR